jgi:hypothetical protein
VEPGTQEEIILKDKFLTQSAPDIWENFKNWFTGKPLDQLVQAATVIFYNRDLEEERRKDKCHKSLFRVMQVTFSGAGPNLQPTSHGDRKAILGPQRQRPPLVPCPICKGNHWKAWCPQHQMGSGSLPSGEQWWVPGPPIQAPVTVIKTEEPWIMLMVKQQKISFLLDFSAIPFSALACPKIK